MDFYRNKKPLTGLEIVRINMFIHVGSVPEVQDD